MARAGRLWDKYWRAVGFVLAVAVISYTSYDASEAADEARHSAEHADRAVAALTISVDQENYRRCVSGNDTREILRATVIKTFEPSASRDRFLSNLIDRNCEQEFPLGAPK